MVTLSQKPPKLKKLFDTKGSFLICSLSKMSLLLCIIVFLLPMIAVAEDIKGLQPFQPNGVFSTFSAESLRTRELGLGISLERTKAPDFYRLTAQLAYGIKDNMELHINFPYMMKYEQSMYGFEDLAFGFKHRLIDECKYNPAIAYLLVGSPGFGRDDFSTNGRVGAGVIVTKKIGPFKGHGNLLAYFPFKSGLNNEYLLNLGLDLAIAHNSKILAELVGRKNYFINRFDLLEWRVGYRQEVSDNFFVTLGAGFDIKDRKPDYRFMLYLSHIIAIKKEPIKRIYE